jgi:TolB-like protein
MNRLIALTIFLSYFMTLSLSGCASVTYSFNGVQLAQLRSLSGAQTANTKQVSGWLAKRQPDSSNGSFQAVPAQAETGSTSPYFTGNGGRGMRLAVLEPSAKGLTDDEKKWMPSTIQSSITGDLNRFSAMTIIDRQNFEKILAEQTLSMSGYFSDDDFLRIGNLINARYILVGSVTKTATAYMLELSVTDAESGERKASYPPTQVSPLALENLTAVKEATVNLLQQLGVQLTDRGRQELRKVPDTAAVQAEIALARGITAQRQGTEVMALSYFFQAAARNPALLEAVNRSSVLNANISSGNIGENVRNDIIWRRNWVQRLTETEQSFDNFNKTESMPYTLFYSDEIKQGAVNYQNETVTLSIETNLRPNHTWGRTVGIPMQRTLRAVYDGLRATQRTGDWNLQSWPNQRVTNLNSFARRDSSFNVNVELLNDKNRVIGRQSFRSDGWWEYEYTYDNGYVPTGIRISDDVKRTVNFTVKADDITDRLTIRIATVNGVAAETAARNGVLQIRALPKAEYDRNSDGYQFVLGEIKSYSGDSKSPIIPSTIWDETVVSIGENAFAFKQLIGVTIPDTVTSIGSNAFAYNNDINSITIGANVNIAYNAFGNDYNFYSFYTTQGRRAGEYSLTDGRWRSAQVDAERATGRERAAGGEAARGEGARSSASPNGMVVLQVLLGIAAAAAVVIFILLSPADEEET